MTTESMEKAVVGNSPRGGLRRVPWAFLLFLVVLALLLVDRVYYLTHFGLIFMEADQAVLWVQATDLAHGIFREPCFYGQSYNVPVEAWLAAPLIMLHISPAVALPVATTGMAIFPFVLLGIVAFRKGQRWMASVLVLIPLALPVEYIVVSCMPRGFVNGIAVAMPAVVLWLFSRGRWSYFWAMFFGVLGVTVNPSASIILLAAGVYGLLMHYRSMAFYVFSALGGILALSAPIGIHLFYKYHPLNEVYQSKLPVTFHWRLWRDTVFLPGRYALNSKSLNLFFGDIVPIVREGSYVLGALAVAIIVLLVLRRFKAAIALLAGSMFVVATLGIERVHSALPQLYYSGSRMYLAVPILFAMFFVWMDPGLVAIFKKRRFMPPVIVGMLVSALLVCASLRHLGEFNPTTRLVQNTWPLAVNTVADLTSDARQTAEVCRKYNVSLVLPCDSFLTCFNEAGPILAGGAFETLYPPFERRTYRIVDERTHLHSAILLYKPSFLQMAVAYKHFSGARMVCKNPPLMLIKLDEKGRTGFDVSQDLGLTYRAKF